MVDIPTLRDMVTSLTACSSAKVLEAIPVKAKSEDAHPSPERDWMSAFCLEPRKKEHGPK